MKRVGKLKKKFLTKEAIIDIIVYLCRSEKRKHWTKGMKKNWKNFFEDFDNNVNKLFQDLDKKRYKFHPFNTFIRYENGKRRFIYSSVAEDQIVDNILNACLEHALMKVKKIIHPNAYGSIKGKGQHELRTKIIRKVKNRDDLYVALCDTHHYYPTIKHDIMVKFLKKHIKDTWVLWLCEKTLERIKGNEGMALGLASSNILGHVYHAAIDWEMICENGMKDYYRFCDDKIMMSNDKKYLHSMVRTLIEEIENCGQRIKPNWRVVHCKEERFEFLGASINSNNARLRPCGRRRIEYRFKKELRQPFNAENEEDRNRILRTWAGIKGGFKGLSVGNLINHWKTQTYTKFFERLNLVEGWIKLERDTKKYRLKKKNEIKFAIDIRSDENKIRFPIDKESDLFTIPNRGPKLYKYIELCLTYLQNLQNQN